MISKNKFFESSIPLLTCPKRVSRGLFFDITSQTEQGVAFLSIDRVSLYHPKINLTEDRATLVNFEMSTCDKEGF